MVWHPMQMQQSAPESMAGYWINRASRWLVRDGDARLRPYGLAMSYLPVLRALADGQPHSQKELARIAGVEQPSMAETLARMERDELVKREPNPADKRAALVTLTRRSRARFPKAIASLREGNRQAMAALSADEQELLGRLLERVVQHLESRALP
jgi:MarR family transcriptional regulator, transcriptional regulator for hemolysin